MFGPSTYIAVDDARGVLVACARQDISKGKMIEGIEDLVCGLNEERDIHALGINDEFAVFDDGVTVWLGPMRLIGVRLHVMAVADGSTGARSARTLDT